MRVYRVEHFGSEVGPYNHDAYCPYCNTWNECFIVEQYGDHVQNRLRYAHSGLDSTHLAWSQWYTEYNRSNLAGFQSVLDLRVWFGGYLSQLQDEGYGIVEYETNRVVSYYSHRRYKWDGVDSEEVYVTNGLRQLIFEPARRLDEHTMMWENE
jgi:hypothetical protein